MKKSIVSVLALVFASSLAYGEALLPYQAGPRLIDGSQLNKMVDTVNGLTGNGTAGAVTGTTGTFSGNVAIGGTLRVTGVSTFLAIPVAPATGITLGATTFSEAALGLYAKGVASGYKIARAATALDGTNPTTVASGLASIVSCNATISTSAAPGVGTSIVTAVISGTELNLYGWKVTSSVDATLIASTGTETIYWNCTGT